MNIQNYKGLTSENVKFVQDDEYILSKNYRLKYNLIKSCNVHNPFL